MKKIVLFCFLSLSCLLISSNALAIPAFPGATGFGFDSVGGRGGRVIHVTNLNDSGVGSLRAALEASGPRIVVFDTGGVIELSSSIQINNPYLTIAGQTAPGDGICLKGASLRIATNNVIVRGMRFRVGDAATGEDYNERDGLNTPQPSGKNPWPHHIVVDRCSFSWSIDELLNTIGPAHHITWSYNIMAEPLDSDKHPNGPHSKGFHLMAGPEYLTIHHNLHTSSRGRNFLLGGSCTSREWHAPTPIEVSNNIIYNGQGGLFKIQQNGCMEPGGPDDRPQRVHLFGNHVKKGPDSKYNYGMELAQKGQVYAGSKFYLDGNISASRPTDDEEEWNWVSSGVVATNKSTVPVFTPSGITSDSVSVAETDILANAGAVPRDTTDTRIVAEYNEGTGSIKNCIDYNAGDNRCDDVGEYVGGYPTYASGTTLTDTDQDGMPDTWETSNGLNSNVADNNEHDLDANYTNIEVYINGFFGKQEESLMQVRGFQLIK